VESPNNNEEKSDYSTRRSELMPLWIGLFVDVLGFYIIIPFLPTFIHLFHTTPFVIGLVLATNAVFTLFFAPIWGKISDKFGRKPILIICQCGTFTGFIILIFANSVEMLFLARMVDGMFGGIFPIVKSIVSDTMPPKERSLQMTNLGVVHTLAGLIGPGVGGILSLFYILGPEYPIATASLAAASLALTALITSLIFVKESWPKEKRIQTQEKIKIHIIRNKDASWLLTLYTFHTIAFTMYTTTLTIYLGIVMGLDTLGISILLTLSGISRAIVRFTVFKPTLKWLGEGKSTIIGLLILVVTFFLIGFVKDIITFVVLIVVISYGVSCSRGLLMSKITLTVSPKEMGKINGYTTTLDSIAQILGPIIGTLILTVLNEIWWGAFMSLLSLVAFFMIFKKIIPYHLKEQGAESVFPNIN